MKNNLKNNKLEDFFKKTVGNVINIYYFLVVGALALILIVLVKYQIFDSKNEREKLANIRYEIKEVYAKRGSIISDDGHKLAFDIEKYNVILDPFNIKDDMIQRVSEILSKYVNKNSIELQENIKKYKSNKKRYMNLKTELDYISKTKLEEEIAKFKSEKKDHNKWLVCQVISERYGLEGQEFESIIGYVNKEKQAVYGVEKFYDDILKGKAGKARVYIPSAESNKEYTLQSIIGDQVIENAEKGYDVHLTIDSIMQYTVDEILKETYENFSAEAVMGILMETDTGKIIAIDSYPKSTGNHDIKNRPITDLFEPGSIFKPITVSAAIEENLINENTVIHSDGFIRVKDRVIHDHDNTTKGSLSIAQIIAHSGNVAMVKIAQLMNGETFYNYLKNFGLSEKTGIDSSYEFSGKLFPLKSFTEVRKSNVAFGQGISMTQIQMLTSLNSTINGGYLLKPFLVDKITDEKGNLIKQNERVVIHRPISENTSAQIRRMLEKVVTTGTGKQIAIDGYRIGGKTGTAQKAGERGYEKGKYFSSFFAFLPADKPKYSILITVNEPKGAYYGAAVALPPAKKIIEKLIKYKGMLPENIPVVETEEIKDEVKQNILKPSIKNVNESLKNNIMPNLLGLSIKEVVGLNMQSKYHKIKIKGRGMVVSQNIPAGNPLTQDSIIILELK